MSRTDPHVAVVAPLSGRAAHLGREMCQAAELAAEESGVDVVLEVHDDLGEVPAGYAVAVALGGRPEMLGVVGHYNADVTLAASGVYDRAGLAMLTPIAANPELTQLGRATTFRFCNRNDRTGLAIATYLRAVLDKHVAAVVATRTAYGRSMAEEFARAFRQLGGDTAPAATVDEGQTDFTAAADAIPDNADVVFYGGSFEGAGLLRELRRRGTATLFATGDGCWDLEGFLRPAADVAEDGEGVLVLASTPQPGHVPGSREVADRYEARFGPLGNYALNTYDATRMMVAAVREAAGEPAPRRAVLAALREMVHPGVAYPGRSSWDADGDNRATVTALNVVRDGRFQTIEIIPNR